MKTEDLVTMLATGEGPVEQNALARRYAAALGWGAFGATLLMALVLGVRVDLAEAALLPMFWVKVVFTCTLTIASIDLALRLSRPGARFGRVAIALTAPVLMMWLLAALTLARTQPERWPDMYFGRTWASCPLLIAMLSVPMFIAVSWAMKGLARTRLRLAGAAAGLLAGTAGALVYCLHCPELAPAFVATWYLLGMLIPTSIGALLGPRLLRW
jgi:hypothetical protein